MKKVFALLMAAALALSAFGCTTWQEPGKVLYLNCQPEAAEAWQKLAAAYSDIYGVEVTVRTVANQDCAAAVTTALAWEDAPTAFHFHQADDLEQFKDSCLDLTGSAVLGQMITGSFNLTDGGAVKALCYSYDAFGLLVNQELLTAAGYEIEAISDFYSLKAVAEDIHSRREELGFDAFATMAQDGSAAWILAELARFYDDRQEDGLNRLRLVLDLYSENSSPNLARSGADEGLDQFARGQAVFCPHSAAVLDTLLAEPYSMNALNLSILPLYCGIDGEEDAALCYTPQSYWAVNAQASEADRAATLDFLNWVVSSEYGISVLQEQYGGVPFKAASGEENPLYGSSNGLLAKGNYPITVPEEENPDRQAAIAAAVAEYTAAPSNEAWQKIREAYVADRT